MTLIELDGGLGNQLFQAALGLRLVAETGYPLVLDTHVLDNPSPNTTPRTLRLHHFNVSYRLLTAREYAGLHSRQPVLRVGRALLRRVLPTRIVHPIQEQTPFQYDESLFRYPYPLYLRGYWQNEAYFKPIESHIRQAFTVKTPPTLANQAMLAQIGAANAVSLHIRRGDYVTNAGANTVHGVLGMDYYQQAIARMAQHVPNPHFFIFSDEPEWAKAHLQLSFPLTVVDINDGQHDYEDLRLMSACQHHITANSSFSWWGAWLGGNPQKVVIAPHQWMRDKTANAHHIIPPEWTAI